MPDLYTQRNGVITRCIAVTTKAMVFSPVAKATFPKA